MKKNLKYILIFIFIVCLLIPISCITIFASTYNLYLNLNYSSTPTYYSAYSGVSDVYMDIYAIKYNDVIYYVDEIWDDDEIDLEGCKFSTSYYKQGTSYSNYSGFNHNSGSVNFVSYSNNTSFNSINYVDVYLKENQSNLRLQKFYTYGSTNGVMSVTQNDYWNRDIVTYNLYDVVHLKQSLKSFNVEIYITINSYNDLNTSTNIPFDKTYNITFYNNDILYNSITISGASASGYAPFEEISQIKYGNTIVYDNSVWSSGYNSTLRYNQNMTMPDVMQLNIDCDNIVTFYVQLYYVYSEYSQTYNIGTFYNKSQEFNSIQVNGLTIGDNKFSSIDTIYYNDIKVYENNNFINSFDEDLYYMYNDINISDINTACNNIVIFTKTHIQPTTDDDILFGVGNILTIIKDFANMLLLNKVTIYCCVAIPLLSFAVFIVVKLKNGNDGDNKIN